MEQSKRARRCQQPGEGNGSPPPSVPAAVAAVNPEPIHGDWFPALRGAQALELLKDADAFRMLYYIAHHARWNDGYNHRGLGLRQAFLGAKQFEADYGITPRRYRTAKKRLADAGFAAFRATSTGTIAT